MGSGLRATEVMALLRLAEMQSDALRKIWLQRNHGRENAMRLPKVRVAIEEDTLVESFVLQAGNLTADPILRGQTQKTISLLYAYHDVLTELIKMAALTTAQGIRAEERYGAATEKRGGT